MAAGPWPDTRLRRTWWTLAVGCAGLSIAAAAIVLGPEDRNRDLFHRLARLALLRHPADTNAHTPLAAVEHELLNLVFACRTGARAPVRWSRTGWPGAAHSW
ncbi:hypothetical protein ACIQB5_45325 [Streptomyces sp. NPDC088560]|uniref:hypothetical protein n=1 Tax=Streptomyces sp. NPDC088560 TaxID=3365868 RepID=UPI00382B7438